MNASRRHEVQRVAPSPELLELMAAVTSRPVPAMPPPTPAPGQLREEWLREVEQIRAKHEQWGREVAAAMPTQVPATAPIPVAGVRDVLEGAVRARVYMPPGQGPFPVLMSFHGGGFWIGGGPAGMEAADASCRVLCLEVGAVVVHVDYRQAPEHGFPVPLEDCYAATRWVAEHVRDLQVDLDRLALCGPSAGANLAAGVAILLRDRGGPTPRFLMLMVPATDATTSSPSIVENGRNYDVPGDAVAVIWSLYLGPDGDRCEPLASLLHHPDLTGLPATHIVVAEFDPLRDDGLRLAQRLSESGVETTVSRFPMGHGVATPDVAEQYLRDVLDRLRDALSG